MIRAALVLACALLLATSVRAEQGTVVRRGTMPAIAGDVRVVGAAGVEVRVPGIERPVAIAWSDVRGIEGAALGAEARAWRDAGEALWRARTRIQRGDWELAAEPLAVAWKAWSAAPPCADAALAAAAQAEWMMRSGRPADAVAPAFAAVRDLRAGTQPGGGWKASARVAEPGSALPPALPPCVVPAADATRLAVELRALDLSADPGLRTVVEAYVAALPGQGARDAAPELPDLRKDAPARHATQALLDLRTAAAGDRSARDAMRAALVRDRRSLPAWFEVWARLALGDVMAGTGDAGLRDRGLALLASLVAAPDPARPWIADCARAALARALESAGDAAAARRVAAQPAEPGTPPNPSLPTGPRPDECVPRELSDRTTAFLQGAGLDRVLLAHLEAQLEAEQRPDQRTQLVERLAATMAGQLEREDDPAGRDALLARALALAATQDEAADPLRMAILRAQYRAAQRVAEDRRAGRAADPATRAAGQQMAQLQHEFGGLALRAARAKDRAEREVSGAVGAVAEDAAARVARDEGLARNAEYFRAWSAYYAAWIAREMAESDWKPRADQAFEWFARIIDPEKGGANPADVSVDLRGNEAFANSILGAALAAGLCQTSGAADAWLRLLEVPGANAAVRAKLPSWRMASLTDRADWAGALALLQQEGDGPQGVPMALIAAGRSVRATAAPGAAEVLTEAVARLAAAGRLRDLALIDAGAEGPRSGAAAQLFAGVRAAAEAQRLAADGKQADARAAWARAADALHAAASVPQGGAAPAIAAGAQGLEAWALRGAGRLPEAADAFVAAARRASGERAGDALWMAVLCCDEAARAGDRATMAAKADSIVAEIVERMPQTAAAVRARAWRTTRMPTPTVTDIDALLGEGVPVELAPAARRAALEGLYRRFRSLQGAERVAAARRALVAGDDRAVGASAEGTVELRRRLEMALALDDRARAADALAALDARVAGDTAAVRELGQELAARRAQVAALDGRLDDARTAAQGIDPGSSWGRVAWGAVLAAAERDPATGDAARAAAARALALAATPPAVRDVATWARAEARLVGSGRPAVDAAGAAAAVDAALDASPRSATLLMADAELRLARGDRARALERLQSALASSAVGSPDWFDAKAMQVEAVAATDPAAARVLLDQVRPLAGGFGDGPVSARLDALDARLPRGSVPGGMR